jgi:hypothetical protein
MKSIERVLVSALVVFYLTVFCAFAEYIFDDVDTLRGINNLLLFVNNLPPEALKLGFTPEQIQSDVSAALQAAGIATVNYHDCCDTPGAPYLFIGIGMVPNNHCNGYAATVHLELRQVANLERDTELSYHAPTWTRGQTIVVEEQSAAREVQKLLRSWINMFIYDHHSANRESKSLSPQGDSVRGQGS